MYVHMYMHLGALLCSGWVRPCACAVCMCVYMCVRVVADSFHLGPIFRLVGRRPLNSASPLLHPIPPQEHSSRDRSRIEKAELEARELRISMAQLQEKHTSLEQHSQQKLQEVQTALDAEQTHKAKLAQELENVEKKMMEKSEFSQVWGHLHPQRITHFVAILVFASHCYWRHF